MFIEAQGLEELSVNAFFMIVGSQEAPLVCTIILSIIVRLSFIRNYPNKASKSLGVIPS